MGAGIVSCLSKGDNVTNSSHKRLPRPHHLRLLLDMLHHFHSAPLYHTTPHTGHSQRVSGLVCVRAVAKVKNKKTRSSKADNEHWMALLRVTRGGCRPPTEVPSSSRRAVFRGVSRIDPCRSYPRRPRAKHEKNTDFRKTGGSCVDPPISQKLVFLRVFGAGIDGAAADTENAPHPPHPPTENRHENARSIDPVSI